MVFARLIALDDCEKARKCLSERVMIPSIINMIVEGRCQELDEENEKTQRETDEETDDSNKALLLRRMADILEQKVKLNALKQ
ncbi:hypothetical protein OXYTRIMIC_341 [Oxytricha trifallax]|uniref:Uncharacterized protein n=1 Tax=Oxytricha trifallax TaxID=1172189 RepID=A0A073IAZ8_9SPIT|nr:hypothetical protein OXYTRIMIC_341 [Oxytricha trifallax]